MVHRSEIGGQLRGKIPLILLGFCLQEEKLQRRQTTIGLRKRRKRTDLREVKKKGLSGGRKLQNLNLKLITL